MFDAHVDSLELGFGHEKQTWNVFNVRLQSSRKIRTKLPKTNDKVRA